LDRRIRKLFPFRFTPGQDRAVKEIAGDLGGPYPTYRLIQGDVGSGKTVVALYFLLVVVAHKGQGALMAPTEVLADQHFMTVTRLLEGSRVRVLRLASGRGTRKRRGDLEAVQSGDVDLVVGTHTVIQKDVRFRRLDALVVDEQHKFGVLQRAALREKGEEPETLVMTATPIPRSLSLTLYGDLDLTLVRGMPPGRKPVRTRWVRRSQREESYRFLREEMQSGRQVFVVYPVIDEPKDRDIRSAVQMFDHLRSVVFPDFRVGLLHGRLAREEKERVLGEFRTCLLFGDPRTDQGKDRLRVMESAPDGFRIAEEDLRIRGPGDFFGTRQSGLPPLKAADPLGDLPLLEEARREAFRIVEGDPDLGRPEHQLLRQTLVGRLGGRIALAGVG
jgi:ATP-dependent DNA helicase RecG